ncbi:O-antigen ligase family protein [Blautia hansenii]|uniref:O-antigen ligase family protein n=1 Tax=Blautia hansenii TaxID=1322 RepID=A0ABX2I9L7_BLAHA|nr:O-antigen ligase family protein [Blautia hansenii]MCB5601462.1 O-antigen ligase family protein [Blautia hansenii]NSJ86854.1 O-antigen ligase family protein [Blautia hansenii]
MKTKECFDLKENRIPEILIALLINLIIFSANNKLMMYTKHLSLFVVVLCLGLFISKKEYLIKINRYKVIYFAFVMTIMVSCVWVSSVSAILDYSLYFISGICIIFSDFSKSFYHYLLKIFKVIFGIFIFSMFLEALVPNVFHIIFGFASFGDVEMRALTSGGAIAGLAFEKAYAAFICNVGLGIIFAEFVANKSYKYIIESIVVMLALMMTGKRTLFIIPIAVLLIYVILFSKNNKFIKLAGVGLGVTGFVIIAYTVIPGASLIIDRIINNEGDVLSGRENFWNYAMEMFHQNPLVGKGFMSFNDYVFNQGFRYYGERWNYQAHNVYIQLLGETGIIGCALIVILIVLIAIKAISIAKKESNFWNVLLVYWIVLFGIYSLTGNTLYYPCQLIILVLEILLISNIKKIKDVSYKVGKSIKWKL